MRREARAIERHAVLLERATVAHDLNDAGHLPESRRDLPLDDGSKLLRVASAASLLLQLEHEDLTEARGDGPQLGLAHALGNLISNAHEPLGDLSASEVEVDGVVEDQRDDADSELGDAPRLREAGNTGHATFDGLRDL